VRDAPTRSLSVASMVGSRRPGAVLIIGGAIAVGVAGYLVATHLVQGKAAPVAAAAVSPNTTAAPAKPSAAPVAPPAPSDSTPTTSIDDLPTATPTSKAVRGGATMTSRGSTATQAKPVTGPATPPTAAATPHKSSGDFDVLSGGRK
jgi:hypothetical protein